MSLLLPGAARSLNIFSSLFFALPDRPLLSAYHGSYRKQAIEVVHLSGRLDDAAKVIAEYWADGPRSATPPGHWNVIAQEISRRDGHSIDDDVKMLFILGNALMDAAIAVWDCKRVADSIRPVSAIRFLFAGKPIRAWAGPGMGTQLIDERLWRGSVKALYRQRQLR